MKKLLHILLALLIATTLVQAQVPQYKKAKVGGTIVPNAGCIFRQTMDTSPRRIQMIYQSKVHFPKAPSGYMTAIYLRNSSYVPTAQTQNPGFTYNFKMALGYTQKDTFRKLAFGNPSVRDTFITGLTPVVAVPVLRQNIKDSPMVWMKFPLAKPFFYNASQEQNLVVDITFGPPWVKDYFCLGDSANGGGQQQMAGFRDTPYVYLNPQLMMGVGSSNDFGFDLTPVGVEAGNLHTGSFSLFPNPNTGTFHINLDRFTPISRTVVTVYSITGQRVLQRTFQPDSPHFSEELTLAGNAKGLYIVEVVADGERIVQRVLVE